MMKYWVMALILCICTGCARHYSKTENLPFNGHGVQFTIPAGWKAEGSLSSAGDRISVEKKGLGSSALLSISALNQNLDVEETLQRFIDAFEQNAIYERADFSPIREEAFGSYNALASSFSFRLFTIDFEGQLCCFSAAEKTIVVMKQVATEDEAATRQGYALIEKTLRILN